MTLILIGFGVFGRGLLDVLDLSSLVWYAFIFILYYSISMMIDYQGNMLQSLEIISPPLSIKKNPNKQKKP